MLLLWFSADDVDYGGMEFAGCIEIMLSTDCGGFGVGVKVKLRRPIAASKSICAVGVIRDDGSRRSFRNIYFVRV